MANPTYTSTERLYLDAEGKPVRADNPNRRSVLVGEGGELPMARAQELGLADADGASIDLPATPAAGDSDAPSDAAGAKAVSGPPANKAQTSSSTKGNGN